MCSCRSLVGRLSLHIRTSLHRWQRGVGELPRLTRHVGPKGPIHAQTERELRVERQPSLWDSGITRPVAHVVARGAGEDKDLQLTTKVLEGHHYQHPHSTPAST